MAEEVPYWKQLQDKVEALEDGFDIKNVELSLLESELHNVLKPSMLLSELNLTHLEMLSEIVDYQMKNKPSERITASKSRLIRLLDIGVELNTIGSTNASLKLINKELVGKMQLLRVENADLRLKIKNMVSAEEYGK